MVSNLDSTAPFGQFTRPFYLGRGLAGLGWDVGVVGVDCREVDYGPSWNVGRQALKPMVAAVRAAASDFKPDLIYAHQNLPATAALVANREAPVVADFHSLPSLEWLIAARTRRATDSARALVRAAMTYVIERYIARHSSLIVAAGSEVADDLQRLYRPTVAVHVVPNGVRREFIVDAADRGRERPPAYSNHSRYHAVASIPAAASNSNRLALDFVAEVASRLTAHSEVLIHVIGTDRGVPMPRVRYEGFVPQLEPWIEQADVCLLPYPSTSRLAGGARNKLLEYLAIGKRLVTTTEGLRGLSEVADWPGVWVAPDDPGAFAQVVEEAVRSAIRIPEFASGHGLGDRYTWDALSCTLAKRLATFTTTRDG